MKRSKPQISLDLTAEVAEHRATRLRGPNKPRRYRATKEMMVERRAFAAQKKAAAAELQRQWEVTKLAIASSKAAARQQAKAVSESADKAWRSAYKQAKGTRDKPRSAFAPHPAWQAAWFPDKKLGTPVAPSKPVTKPLTREAKRRAWGKKHLEWLKIFGGKW